MDENVKEKINDLNEALEKIPEEVCGAGQCLTAPPNKLNPWDKVAVMNAAKDYALSKNLDVIEVFGRMVKAIEEPTGDFKGNEEGPLCGCL